MPEVPRGAGLKALHRPSAPASETGLRAECSGHFSSYTRTGQNEMREGDGQRMTDTQTEVGGVHAAQQPTLELTPLPQDLGEEMATLREGWALGRRGTPVSRCRGLSPSPTSTKALGDSERDPLPAPREPPAQTRQAPPLQNSVRDSGPTGPHTPLPTRPPGHPALDAHARAEPDTKCPQQSQSP